MLWMAHDKEVKNPVDGKLMDSSNLRQHGGNISISNSAQRSFFNLFSANNSAS